ncbi:MAG: hypothetical protein PHV68_09255 [Candidatus Gastranaerophilales bacterium]|nr:hypothetical protein [Candidatus Gastranaerophilales bacterium]
MKRIAVSMLIAFMGFAPAICAEQNMTSAVYKKTYEKVTKDNQLINALEAMKGTSGEFSRKAILGENLSHKPMKVMFKNLGSISALYANYDALGWKKGDQLYIYINQKHMNAPAEALASLLSHEAMHQDEYNSINEETYAWTMEAQVWTEFRRKNPNLEKNIQSDLVQRENTLSEMFKNANYTSKYIRNTVSSNPGYQDLPPTSPGFENVK